jgi:hypothetical protein
MVASESLCMAMEGMLGVQSETAIATELSKILHNVIVRLYDVTGERILEAVAK